MGVTLSSQAYKVLAVIRVLTLPIIAPLEPSEGLAEHTVFIDVIFF